MRTFHTLLAASILTFTAAAQGPDVIVGDLNGMNSYGSSGTIFAYSVGTTSCNIGNVWLNWFQGSNQHPVIGQAFYRIKNGRFEQIGFSWLKHGFYALSGNLCYATGCQSTNGEHLGIHCSDPYDAGLNGDQGNGPRSEVNASTGYFPYPPILNPPVPTLIERRIQCQLADIDTAQNAGAIYYAEGQYVTPDDAAAGNKNNNASSRRISFASTGVRTASFIGATAQQTPAILQWQLNDPTVVISYADIVGDGRFIIAKKVTSLGGGNFHYEFAVHNLNSDRSGRGFTVNFPGGTSISNLGFKSVPYHSGEVYSNTAWTPGINGTSANWVTQLAQVNINANALRFGTTYNFWCDATAASETSTAIELFKPPACPAEPVVTPPNSYALNTSATFDNPTLTSPVAGPVGDDAALTVPIGFTFGYWGTNYTTVNICTNGFLNFGAQDTTYANTCIPNAGTPNALIAPLWADLETAPTGAGNITYKTLGVAPNRRFVVSWNGVAHYGAPTTLESFKVILDETTNKITSSIIASANGGSDAVRGVENQAGTAGVSASCNVPGSAVAGTSQTYTPISGILPSADLTISGSTGPNGVLTFSINSVAKTAPVVLVASFDPGPLNLGPLGTLNIGLTPGLYVVLADGAGALQPANPADFTDWYCGDYQLSIPVGPAGLPPSLTVNVQGVVISTTSVPPAPNGQFHITDMEQIIT